MSLPLFQFLLLRWYFRLFIWARFLWQVSRIELQLMPTHPDRCGGWASSAWSGHAFAPLLLAQGVMLAGLMANRIFYAGAKLPEFKVELIGLVAVMVFAVLGPLLVFSPAPRSRQAGGPPRVRRAGAALRARVRPQVAARGAPPDEPLLGSADIQSLADLGNSYEVVKDMRWFRSPCDRAATGGDHAVPVVPLMLTMISLEELVGQGPEHAVLTSARASSGPDGSSRHPDVARWADTRTRHF